jgi:hypothetical protein
VTASDGTLSVSDIFTLSVPVANGSTYTARAGVVDTFIIDASKSISVTIVGFENGDELRFLNYSQDLGVSFENLIYGDGAVTIFAGSTTVNLTNITNDLFNDESSFEAVYGAQAITYVL